MSICKNSLCVILAIDAVLLAVLLAPLATTQPKLVALDDIQSWGLKGPYLDTLSENMKGVYFLDGNQAPWNVKDAKCNATEVTNKTLCRNGFKLSQLILLDTSWLSYDRAERMITQYAPALGVSEHKEHKGGMPIAMFMLLLRICYTFDKNDPEFADRSPELFEGMMRLYFAGMSTKTLFGMQYRVTAEDNGNKGAVIDRFTWIGGTADDYKGVAYDEPQPKSEQLHDFHYKLRRIMDADGTVDKGVLADMKKVYGENVIFLGAQ